jgi:hypothetical protein
MSGIRLSEKHGVNPCITQCFFCHEEKNELVLFGKLKDDAEAPRRACIDRTPCDKCRGFMEQGVILISVDESKGDADNPWHTGGWCVVRDEFITRVLQPDLAEVVLKMRVAFVPDDAWDKIGLPRGSVEPSKQA